MRYICPIYFLSDQSSRKLQYHSKVRYQLCSCAVGAAFLYRSSIKRTAIHSSKDALIQSTLHNLSAHVFTATHIKRLPIATISIDQGFWIFNWLKLSLDSEDGFHTDCWNISHQEQSFSGLQSPKWSFTIKIEVALLMTFNLLFSNAIIKRQVTTCINLAEIWEQTQLIPLNFLFFLNFSISWCF